MKKTKISRIDMKVFSAKQKASFIFLLILAFVIGLGLPVLLGSNMLFSIRTTRTKRRYWFARCYWTSRPTRNSRIKR